MDHVEHTPEDLLGRLNEGELKNAPRRLFCCGDVQLLRRSGRVAIIGSRQATPDGVRRARKLSLLLTKCGVTVVSGLAEGIDTAAHTAAIEAGGRTIAVIGTPLDHVLSEVQRRASSEDHARAFGALAVPCGSSGTEGHPSHDIEEVGEGDEGKMEAASLRERQAAS